MLPTRVILVDYRQALVDAWSEAFEPYDTVEAHASDFFAHDADAMVSPANSFGIMDGGLDLAIRETLGGDIQREVQRVILERHHGELPVGAAEIAATGHRRWPFLVVAPTMRVPESVANTVNAYVAFRATLLAVVKHNLVHPDAPIRSLLVPGLGTGVGGMEARRCAAQMRLAYDQVRLPARIPSFGAIRETHRILKSSS